MQGSDGRDNSASERPEDRDVGQGPEHVVQVGAGAGAEELGSHAGPEGFQGPPGQPAGAGRRLRALEPGQDPWCGGGFEDTSSGRGRRCRAPCTRAPPSRPRRRRRSRGSGRRRATGHPRRARSVGRRHHVDAAAPPHAVHRELARDSCQASGSSPSSSEGASGPVTTGGLFSAKPCMIVPPAFQPAQRSACCSMASPLG